MYNNIEFAQNPAGVKSRCKRRRRKKLQVQMEITYFVKNHFGKIHKDDEKISWKSLSQNYLRSFGVIPIIFPISPNAFWCPGRVKGWKNGVRGAQKC
jgi:hypothetical protein